MAQPSLIEDACPRCSRIRENAIIPAEHTRDVAIADAVKTRNVKLAAAAKALSNTEAAANKTYADLEAQHEHWMNDNRAKARHTRDFTIANSAEMRDQAIADAARVRDFAIAAAVETRDSALAQAEAAFSNADAAARKAAVDTWAAASPSAWADYQSELLENALQYTNQFNTLALDHTLDEIAANRSEAETLAFAAETFADSLAVAERTRTIAESLQTRDLQIVANNADKLRAETDAAHLKTKLDTAAAAVHAFMAGYTETVENEEGEEEEIEHFGFADSQHLRRDRQSRCKKNLRRSLQDRLQRFHPLGILAHFRLGRPQPALQRLCVGGRLLRLESRIRPHRPR